MASASWSSLYTSSCTFCLEFSPGSLIVRHISVWVVPHCLDFLLLPAVPSEQYFSNIIQWPPGSKMAAILVKMQIPVALLEHNICGWCSEVWNVTSEISILKLRTMVILHSVIPLPSRMLLCYLFKSVIVFSVKNITHKWLYGHGYQTLSWILPSYAFFFFW